MPRCSKCGFMNPDDAKSCSKCGQKITGGGLLDDVGGLRRRAPVKGPASISVGPTTYGDTLSFVSEGDVVQQIKSINVRGLSEAQLEAMANQLNLLMNRMGVSLDVDKDAKFQLAKGDRAVVDLISQKVKEVEESTGKLVGNPETYLRLGNVAYSYGDLAKAIENYDKALKLKPDFESALYNKGNALDDSQKFIEAIDCYSKVLSLNPKNEKAWYNKGVALLHLEKHIEAIQSFDRATELKPDYEKAWNNKGVAYHYLGQYPEAVKCYDKVLELNPNDVDVCINKGVALKKLGRIMEAIQAYDRAISINPTRIEA